MLKEAVDFIKIKFDDFLMLIKSKSDSSFGDFSVLPIFIRVFLLYLLTYLCFQTLQIKNKFQDVLN